MKTLYWAILVGALCVGGIIGGVWYSRSTPAPSIEEVLYDAYALSKEYGSMRMRTEHVLVSAKTYPTYAEWKTETQDIIHDWGVFVGRAEDLGEHADRISRRQFAFIHSAYAYDKNEISQIFDAAPAGKKISTLAKHLGVDAKKAMKILEQDQAQVTADAWNEAGDTLQKLETSAVVIKDTAKVSVFVGTVVATGGAAGFASGSMVSQASVLVSGADMILEVTDDAAKVGLGNHNKVSALIGDARKVTEPLSGLLAVADIPKNVTKGIEKLSAVTFGAEQLNGVVQEGKIIGIELPAAKKQEKFQNLKKYSAPVYISSLKPDEAHAWVETRSEKQNTESVEDEVAQILNEGGSVIRPIPTLENQSQDTEVGAQENSAASILLVPKKESIGNDWQGALRILLFSQSPIEIIDGVFSVTRTTDYTGGGFSGTGKLRLEGTFDERTRTLSGTHYRIYEGVYKGEQRSLVYSGTFSHILPLTQEEFKISFPGKIESTRMDGKGKPYTTTSEGGVSQAYTLRPSQQK